ncbi:MAG: transporter substrate-binding domain-containing protein, partial [Eubacteriales bacterium]|nr:transporter substrate-binding domain-containing protein [Eubacteriales bacterium]
MMKKLFALALSVMMLLSFAACAAKETAEAPAASEAAAAMVDMSAVKLLQDGVLSIGVEIGYPPFEDFAEDVTTPIGYDIDFANALGEKLGVTINFINTAWDG